MVYVLCYLFGFISCIIVYRILIKHNSEKLIKSLKDGVNLNEKDN